MVFIQHVSSLQVACDDANEQQPPGEYLVQDMILVLEFCIITKQFHDFPINI